MNANFDVAFKATMGIEGGYTKGMKGDSGGETYKGISRNNFPNWKGWSLIDTYKNLSSFPSCLTNYSTLQQYVKDFYKSNFWDILDLDTCNNQAVANEMFDTGVNMGVGVAAQFLQIALNVTNPHPDIKIDRVIGPSSMGEFNNHNHQTEILKILNSLKGARYVGIVQQHPEKEVFMQSWMSRVAGIIAFIFFLHSLGLCQTCPDQGVSGKPKFEKMDRLKNRPAVTQDSVDVISLESILEDGMDTARWSNDYYVGLVGYVKHWKYGGPESCNCKSKDKSMWDIHLVISQDSTETDDGNCMIWEISHKAYEANPQLKDPAYLKGLVGHKVYGEGPLFADLEHWNNAKNSGHAKLLWRKTVWEIHPLLVLEPVN